MWIRVTRRATLLSRWPRFSRAIVNMTSMLNAEQKRLAKDVPANLCEFTGLCQDLPPQSLERAKRFPRRVAPIRPVCA